MKTNNPNFGSILETGSSESEQFAQLDTAFLHNLAERRDEHTFFESWLSLQAGLLKIALNGVVVVVDDIEQDLRPAAYWPPTTVPGTDLIKIAESAIRQKCGVVQRSGETNTGVQSIAYPILIDGDVAGVVGFNVKCGTDASLQSALRQLQWGAVWLENHTREKQFSQVHSAASRLSTTLDLIAVSLEYDDFGPAASATLTEIAAQLRCERASFGVLRFQHIKILAMSHTAVFSKRMNMVRAISRAMEEAVDQERIIVTPANDENIAVTRCHEELSRRFGFGGSIVTIPLYDEKKIYGALTLEYVPDKELFPDDVELVTALGATIGRILENKRKENRWLLSKMFVSITCQLHRLFGPGFLGRKIAVCILLAMVTFFSIATSPFRVTTDAILEGRIQRILVAPYDGFIADAPIRAGDYVQKGHILARLDDRDLQLELEAWSSRRKQYLAERKRAIAEHDLAQANVFLSQIDEADVQLELIHEKLKRADIVAPFDGVVLSGDLTQSLGRAVQIGDTLFQVAPLESYRVFLKIDERDIQEIEIGQSGSILLNALPHQPIALTVQKISSVTLSEDGINLFRVEAFLNETPTSIRPGMEGVAKITIREQKLIWIWSRGFLNWVRVQYWKWWL